jgi:hypothetical protein
MTLALVVWPLAGGILAFAAAGIAAVVLRRVAPSGQS